MVFSSAELKTLAHQAGFDLCGLARAEPLPQDFLLRWLEAGMDADMDWLKERLAERLDVSLLLPNAKTVLALACNYYADDGPSPIARYARGRDYHYTLKDFTRTLRRLLKARWPELRSYSSVDFGPVMEKVWAVKAGLGFVGKNGCLITEKYGSWVVLSTFILDVETDAYDTPGATDGCGQCRVCIDACPTEAINLSREVDARRCLSFHTIENERPLPLDIRRAMEDIVFGCDICQEVCPLNNFPVQGRARFVPRPMSKWTTRDWAAMSREDYEKGVPGTPLARVQYDGLRRNAAYALGAARDVASRGVLEKLSGDPHPQVQEAAQWALGRLPNSP